jgi:hypothetical protein
MNLSINFPPELEDALRLQAQAEAKTPEEFALTALLEKLNGLSPPPLPWLQKTGSLSSRRLRPSRPEAMLLRT